MQTLDLSLILTVLGILAAAAILVAALMPKASRKPPSSTPNSSDARAAPAARGEPAGRKLPLAQEFATTLPNDATPPPARQSPSSAAALVDGTAGLTAAPDDDKEDETFALDPTSPLLTLTSAQKHRIVYHFIPNLRGMLLADPALDGYLGDAVQRAHRKGWGEASLIEAASSGKWRRPPADQS